MNFLQAKSDNCSIVEQVMPFPLLYSMGPPDSVEICKNQREAGWSVKIIQAFITSNFLRGRGSEKAFNECQGEKQYLPPKSTFGYVI